MSDKKESQFDKAYEFYKKKFPNGHPIKDKNPDALPAFIMRLYKLHDDQAKLESDNGIISEQEFKQRNKQIQEEGKQLKKFTLENTTERKTGNIVLEEMNKRLTNNPLKKAISIAKDVADNKARKENINIAKIDPLEGVVPLELTYDPLAQRKSRLDKKDIKQEGDKFTIDSADKEKLKDDSLNGEMDGKFNTTPKGRDGETSQTGEKDGKFTTTSPDRTPKGDSKPTTETKSTSSLGTVGKSFVERIDKIDTGATESLFKPAHHITEAERDSVMSNPVYKDKTSPFFNTAQKLVEDSFKYQYPGNSRGYHNIREQNSLPTASTPLKDSSGTDVNKTFGNHLAQAVDKFGEQKAVTAFQRTMNKVTRTPRKIVGIAQDIILPPQEPLKEDGIFGPKTKTRMQEIGATHGVSPVINMFSSGLKKLFG